MYKCVDMLICVQSDVTQNFMSFLEANFQHDRIMVLVELIMVVWTLVPGVVFCKEVMTEFCHNFLIGIL